MNKKVLMIAVALMALAMLATPLVSAKPATEKNNEKFEYFKLIATGLGEEEGERGWTSPPNSDPPYVGHVRGVPWDSETVTMVELTVGTETFTMVSSPYSVDYTCTFDSEGWFDELGIRVRWTMRITDVIPVYDDGVEIGTLVLIIHTVVDASDFYATGDPTLLRLFGGAITGYGTGDLKGVHISGVDLGVWPDDPFNPTTWFYGREGTITGWPVEITNSP